MEEQQLNNKAELQGLTIKELFYKYVRFLPLVVLFLALALLGAWLYLRYATQVYGASGTLLINNEQTSGGGRDDKVEDLITGNNRSQNIQNEIEVLKSKPLMKRVVQRLGLELEYKAVGKVKEVNVYNQAPFYLDVAQLTDSLRSFTLQVELEGNNAFKINGEPGNFKFGQYFKNENGVFRLIQRSAASEGVYKISRIPTASAANRFASVVAVAPKIAGTSILNISLQSTNAHMAADIINTLMVQYDSLTIEQNNYSNDQMIGFIDLRLDKLKREVDSIKAIELALRQREELFNVDVQSGTYLDKLKESGKFITELDFKVEAVDLIVAYIQDPRNKFNEVVPSSLGLDDLTLAELVGGYNKAQLERQALVNANIPEGNPAIQEANGIIEKQRRSLLENLKVVKMGYLDQVSSTRKNTIDDKSYLQQLPYKVKDLVEMERQIATKLTLYNLLEGRREEAAIARASTVSSSKVVDQARVSETPVAPNRTMIQLMAVLIGLGIPVIGIVIKELLNDKISSRTDIERNTNTPILGEVGHSYSDNTLVVNKTSRKMVAEQFRIIRSNLQYVLTKKENPVIMVTSSFSGEGKSFVSTNVAAVMALTGKRTVILEFDIRKPKVLSGLNMIRKAGISNYLVGKAELQDLIVPVPDIDNLFVLPCGPIPPNPSELLLDERVKQMFDYLKSTYDVVVIDTAPVGMVSDALTLAQFADCTLYLVRQGHTFKKQVVLIDELYNSNKLPKVSIIINDVKLKSGYGYYGYGRYGYGYGYGEKSGGYYDDEQKPKGFWDKLLDSLNPLQWFRKKKK